MRRSRLWSLCSGHREFAASLEDTRAFNCEMVVTLMLACETDKRRPAYSMNHMQVGAGPEQCELEGARRHVIDGCLADAPTDSFNVTPPLPQNTHLLSPPTFSGTHRQPAPLQ